MSLLNERPLVSGLVIGLVVGILIGWLVIGWGLWPVQWTDANPAKLREDFKATYVQMTADLYHQSPDPTVAKHRMREWPDGARYTCELAGQTPEASAEKQRLLDLAQALSPGIDCQTPSEIAVEEEEGGMSAGRIALLCGAGLLAVALVGGAFYFFYQRGPRQPVEEALPVGEPTAALSATTTRTIPLAQFPTEFNIGHDTYDDSFSIETATGEFLGECGVGISESIGVGSPKKVTAFEVWLFDKNDIRTITKVLMSEHAYYDEALRAKLAPKGEAALANPGETIVLETASLIINANIVEMDYGTGELPQNSFFDRLVVELAAWAKEGTEEAGTEPSDQAEFILE